ncbi:MAG: DNA polymerase III subunit gamma/tau [Acidimicrobiales bacterium]
MAYQSLYRRYRSQKFSELRGQSHVTSALQTAVAEGRHGHAYLFSGPRGTGKTSTARILAKALNCPNVENGEPCGECESCMAIEQGKSFDLHELDAASHNKVDDIRDLISKVHLGSPGQTKVYILDEVHMLSAGAENALLKTLEEPPEHVVFVLATTEPHKVVPTIRSRTQHFEFHLLPAEELAEHVKFIIEDAGLTVDDGAVDYVLTQGGGSARDTLSALDLVAAGGVPAGSDVGVALAKAIGAGDGAGVIGAVQEGLTTGQEPRIIGEITVDLLRNAFLASMGAPLDHLNDTTQAISRELATELGAATLTRSLEALGQALVEMRQAPDPRVPLEVTLLRLCRPPGPLPMGEPAAAAAAPAPAPAAAAPSAAAPPAAQPADPALAGKVEALERQVAALQAQLNELAASGVRSGEAEGAAPSGPAAAARNKLSEVAASKPPPSPRSKRRPGSTEPDPAPTPSGETQPAAAETQPPAAETPAPAAETQPAAAAEAPAADQNPAAPPPAAEQAAAAPAPAKPALSAALTLASVIDAFDDQLDGVKQKVRVRFKGGRVLSVEGSTVVFGVPQAIHRDRCIEVKQDIEDAFTNHFGQTVTLDIVVDDEAPTPTMDPSKIQTKAPRDITPDDEVGPVEDLVDANDQSADGLERLTKAFPGSTVVDPPPE